MTYQGKEKPHEGNPRNVVVMLIHNDKGETLFIKRSQKVKYLPGVWALPSGHIEEGESYIDTAKRETREELGVEVETVDLLETIEKPQGEAISVQLIDIPVSQYKGTPHSISDEIEILTWMRMEDFFNTFTDEQIGSTLQYLRPRFQKPLTPEQALDSLSQQVVGN